MVKLSYKFSIAKFKIKNCIFTKKKKMSFTVKINENKPKAVNIVNMLKMLALDYDFVQVVEENDNLDFMTKEQREEFERRYEYTVNNMEEGKSWEEIEKKYLINE